MITLKTAFLSLAVCATAGYLCVPLKPGDPAHGTNATIHLDVWQPWGGPLRDGFGRIVDEFNATHPGIKVRPVYFSGDRPDGATKFLLAAAGGVPPDLTFVDGPQVTSWAELGLLDPLDDFFAREQIGENAFWPPCWRQCEYRGHSWALTFEADPNFALVWNKSLFKAAGLDPNTPPKTTAEVEADNARLTQFDEHGFMRQMGMMPWATYGGANTVYTWGWIFGGEFFDPAHNRITADDPKNVAALEWLNQCAHRYGFEKVNAFNSTFGNGAQDPFFTGRIAIEAMHMSVVQEIPEYAPGLDFGVAPLPAPPQGEYGASWVGGWTLAVPRDSARRRSPERRAAALAFLKWACATPAGTAFVAKTIRLFPGYKACSYFDEIRHAAPGSYEATFLRPYLQILETTKHLRPAMPAQAAYRFALDRAFDRTLYGDATAAAALAEARQNTQSALDTILHRQRIGAPELLPAP